MKLYTIAMAGAVPPSTATGMRQGILHMLGHGGTVLWTLSLPPGAAECLVGAEPPRWIVPGAAAAEPEEVTPETVCRLVREGADPLGNLGLHLASALQHPSAAIRNAVAEAAMDKADAMPPEKSRCLSLHMTVLAASTQTDTALFSRVLGCIPWSQHALRLAAMVAAGTGAQEQLRSILAERRFVPDPSFAARLREAATGSPPCLECVTDMESRMTSAGTTGPRPR